MKLTFLKGVALGAVIGATSATATVAVATTLSFTLGRTNRVDAASRVTNIAVNGSSHSVAAPLVTLENTTNDPAATALQLLVASGHAPFTTNSTAKVAKLNADKLDGHDSTDFVQGGGRIVPIDVGQATGDTRPVVDLGFVRVDHFCGGPAESGQYDLTTGPLEVVEFSDNGGGNPEHQRLSAEGSFGSSFWATDPTGDRYTFSFEATGGVATAYLFSYTWNDTFLHQTGCTIQGYAVVHGA